MVFFGLCRNYLTHLEYISTIGKLQWFIQKIYLSLLPKEGLGVTLFLYVFSVFP